MLRLFESKKLSLNALFEDSTMKKCSKYAVYCQKMLKK